MLDFLEFGEEHLYKGDLIVLATDGMETLLESAEELGRNRGLKSDDRAVIIIRVE